jgi:ribosome biogenesis GTPase A
MFKKLTKNKISSGNFAYLSPKQFFTPPPPTPIMTQFLTAKNKIKKPFSSKSTFTESPDEEIPFTKNMLTCTIVGKPNVGKSSIYNSLLGKGQAIVHPTPGITRDWQIGLIKDYKFPFRVIDTGGIYHSTTKGMGSLLKILKLRDF